MDAQEAWDIAYNQLELQLDRASFDTWLRDTVLIEQAADSTFVIGVRNAYARDMLQNRLYRNVCSVLRDVCGEPVEIRFEVSQIKTPIAVSDSEMPLFQLLAKREPFEDVPTAPLHTKVERPERPPIPESDLNPRFIFDRFIVNGSNRIAYEAARAIAEFPARRYNPFLVYGGVGLGKTHILQAIAHECQMQGYRAVYIPSEAFTNDLIDAIRHKTMAMFREKYRSADILIVDDIQFIAGKDSTQEEFFHTFNALYTYNKQIILASDRHPRELATLEDRLRSRFEGGLVTDIQPLEYETRLAIVRMWMRERDLYFEPSIIDRIASYSSLNVRELEGMFNQVIAKANLGDLTVDTAEDTLEQFEMPHQYPGLITLDQVVDSVAQHFHIKSQDLTSKRRTGRINVARQIAMYLARDLTDASLPQIGERFGRSHTTILHGCNKIMEEMELDASLRDRIEHIRIAIIN